jgi:hypothetical protein
MFIPIKHREILRQRNYTWIDSGKETEREQTLGLFSLYFLTDGEQTLGFVLFFLFLMKLFLKGDIL